MKTIFAESTPCGCARTAEDGEGFGGNLPLFAAARRAKVSPQRPALKIDLRFFSCGHPAS